MSSEPSNGRSRKPKQTTKAQKPKVVRDKITLLIQRDTSVKLSTLAAMKGLDRSTLADSILTEALRHVVISLRGPLAEGGAGGRSSNRAKTASQRRRLEGRSLIRISDQPQRRIAANFPRRIIHRSESNDRAAGLLVPRSNRT